MKMLTPEYWKNFKSDGRLFEQLSKTLIEYEYGQTDFYIVGGPGDGGKDIYKDVPLLGEYHNQIWAQCKFYTRTLSFDDISFTLLMAYLKNTNQILIFSYSKVSASFLSTLNEYITRTAKDVVLYADEELEALIIKHRKKLIKEHPNFFLSFPEGPFQPTEEFKTDYQLYINDHRVTDHKVTISINSICELVIIVTNKMPEPRRIRISLINNRTAQTFCFLDFSPDVTADVASNHTIVYKTHIILKNNVNHTSLPTFEISSANVIKRIHSHIQLNCRWLADTPLIGQKYYNALEQIEAGVQYTHFHLVYVYGTSGVGKSRLLKEAQSQCIRVRKKMIYIDSEKRGLSCKQFIDLLCSRMTLLPVFPEKVAVMSNSDDITMEYATRILYDSSFDIAEQWENVAKYFAYLMEQERIVLVLDNLQSFDKLSLDILDHIITLLINSNCESDILLGINTDYIYNNSSFNDFYVKLRYVGNSAREFYTGIKVEGLEPQDSELYIRECLSRQTGEDSMSSINYDRAVKRIANHCGSNPFYIQQYLLYLYQKDIIRRGKRTLYYFYDVEGFWKSFRSIPKDIMLLIKERETFLISHLTLNSVNKYRQLIYLVNLTKALPDTVYYDIIGDQGFLNSMLDLGFFALEGNAIVPVHNYYSQFYRSQYAISGTPEELLDRFIVSLDKLNLSLDLALPYFWARYRRNGVSLSELNCAIRPIISWNLDCSAFNYCLGAVSNSVEKYYAELGIDSYIEFYRSLNTRLDESLGLGESVKYYDKFFSFFLSNIEEFVDCATSALPLITSFFIHLINLEDYEKCFHSMDALETSLDIFSTKNRLKYKYQINRCKIMIYNRNDIVMEAVTAARENLKLLNHSELEQEFKDEFRPSALRSVGNTYFYSTDAYANREKIVVSWKASFDDYVKDHGLETETCFSDQPKVAAFAKGLAADMIANKAQDAEIKAKFFENAFDKMNMVYYEMQLRLLMAIYLTWKWADSELFQEHQSEINRYIDQTIDLAAVYGRQLTTINAFHMRAVVHLLAKNYEIAMDNYIITADLLMKYIKTERDFSRWWFFWVDFARTIKRCGGTYISLASRYGDWNTRQKIQRICLMPDHEFRHFEDNYVPMTALTNKGRTVNFPKL